jgi:hypothetical protein
LTMVVNEGTMIIYKVLKSLKKTMTFTFYHFNDDPSTGSRD